MSSPRADPRARRIIAVGGLGGFAFATTTAWALRVPQPAAVSCLAVVVALTAVASGFLGRRALVAAVLVLLFASGVARGTFAAAPSDLASLAQHGTGAMTLDGVVSSTETPGVVVDVDHMTSPWATKPEAGRVLLTGRNLPAFAVGDRVSLAVTALHLPGRRPGSRSMEALERDGVDAIATISSASVTGAEEGPQRWLAFLRRQLGQAVDAQLPEPAASLVLGIGMGIHQPIDAATRASLQDAGLYHVVAVSGLKVIIVVTLIDSFAGGFGWSSRRRRMIGLVGVAMYVLISGSGAAALRSALMASLAFMVRRDGRRLDPFVGLALLAAILCGLEPRIGLDVGFQLSFLGTAGILLLGPWLQARLPGPRVLIDPLAVTLAAQVATTPIIAATFGVVSVVGPPANALVLPFLPLLVALAVIGAVTSAVFPALAWVPLHLAEVLADLTVGLARLAASLPGAALHPGHWPSGWVMAEGAGVVAGIVVAVVASRRRWQVSLSVVLAGLAAAMSAVVAAGVATRPDGVARVTVLDVGAAPAVLIETGDGHRALIDTGSDPARLQTALGRVISPLDGRIDLVVLTSGDRHAGGGLAGLAGRYEVGKLAIAAQPTAGLASGVAALMATGTVVSTDVAAWRWDGLDFTCTGADPAAPAGGCVLRVSAAATWRLLVAGVTSTAQQDAMSGDGTPLTADVLVAPPGGTMSPLLLHAAGSHVVAVPTAPGSRAVRLDPSITVITTGTDGDISFSAADGGLTRD